MKIKKIKQILAFTLAGALAVSGAGMPAIPASAGEIVAFEKTAREVSMERGIVLSFEELSSTTFDGTNVYSMNGDEIKKLFVDNIKNADSLEISIKFKITSAAKNYIKLLEICDSANNASGAAAPQSTLGIVISTGGVVYLETGAFATGTDWQPATGVNVNDGSTHTLKVTLSADSVKAQIDNSAEVSASSSGDSTKNTKNFMSAFFGGTSSTYKDWRQEIDTVVIGGVSSGCYFDHTNYVNLTGEVSEVTIAGKNSGIIQTDNEVTSIMFAADSLDNTWLFGGGVETQGRFAEIGGVRNYIGQFEEYVRWVKRVDGDIKGMQRYTINAGKAGQDAAEFAERLPGLIEDVDPMAVAYLIGPEDYLGESGTEAFQTALGKIIDEALALKDGNGCAVIQYPHAVADAEVSENIQEYIDAAEEVIQGKDSSERERIAIVDHYHQRYADTMLTDDGLLNADGHYEMAKQFSQAVYGSTDGFQTISETWTAEEAPDTYLDILPEVTASEDSLTVSVEGVEGNEWNYILTADGTEISGTASGNPFRIENLPAGAEYELIVQTGDGVTQLSKVMGTITEGDEAQAPALTELQQAIRDKVDNAEKPLTWLFMGDSITHAAAHTHGYDGIAQIFEKYLKEDLGRTDDIVVNTAVSGATANSAGRDQRKTLVQIYERMTKYKPDIVSIMLGTNDTIDNTYNAGLKSIVTKIREANPDALIIFRSPTPAKSGSAYATKLVGASGSVARMKAVAEEDGNILFIDQYTEWYQETVAYPYLFTSNFYYGDNNIHPGAAGHLRMMRQFVEGCGLNTNTRLANLSYEFPYTETENSVKPVVKVADTQDAITVSKSELQTAYGASETIGEMTVILTDSDGRTYTKSTGLDGAEVTMSLPTSRNYKVKVVGDIKGNTAKHVTFTGENILLTTGSEKEDLQAELTKQEELYSSSMNDYTEESVTAFREAYEAAQKARDENVTDVEKLAKFTEALAKSAEALVKKTVVTGTQTVTISGSTVTVPENAAYTASDVTWNADKSKGSFTLTADAGVRFDDGILITVSNAEELRIKDIDAEVEDSKITVTFTVKEKPSSGNDNQQQQGQQQGQSGQTNQPSVPEPEVIKPGKTYAVGNYRYRVISTTDMTAEVVGLEKTDIKKVTIYSSVKLGGKNYTVTSVGANAFKGNKNITSVVVKKNVKTIGKNAFAGCTKLKKVTINSAKLTTINAKAFSGCKSLKTIIIKSKVLKKVGKNAFKGIHKKAVIKVPKAKRTAYTKKVLKNKGQAKTVKIK